MQTQKYGLSTARFNLIRITFLLHKFAHISRRHQRDVAGKWEKRVWQNEEKQCVLLLCQSINECLFYTTSCIHKLREAFMRALKIGVMGKVCELGVCRL